MGTLKTIQRRLRDDESGFSLIELLVVIIIIGILAAIGFAFFLEEQDKAQDASAKSNVSGLGAEVESCWADEETLRNCDQPTAAELGDTGLPVSPSFGEPANDCSIDALGPLAEDPAPGEVKVVASQVDCYVIKAVSEADAGGTNHIFIARRADDGTRTRECGPVSIRAKGGCPPDGTW